MLAACFIAPQDVQVLDIPDPQIVSDTDAIVSVRTAGLCGSDLHPFFGREQGMMPGTVMGHEFVGEIVAIGDRVEQLRVGQSVCTPFTTNCGNCFYCANGLTARCDSGQLFGWRNESKNANELSPIGLHGGQSELVRVPLADSTLVPVVEGVSDEFSLLLGDNLATAYFAASLQLGEFNNRSIGNLNPDSVYAVIGCGNVGLLTIYAAKRMGATHVLAIDLDPARIEIAKQLGATAFFDESKFRSHIYEMTDGRGADGVIELVGLPAAQELAFDVIRPGGVMSVIGCHCTPNFAFSPTMAYDKNLTYRTGRCNARAMMELLRPDATAMAQDLDWCISHRFGIEDSVVAYDTFANRKDGCVKAVLNFD